MGWQSRDVHIITIDTLHPRALLQERNLRFLRHHRRLTHLQWITSSKPHHDDQHEHLQYRL
jgi:hypothetical protein